MARVTPDSEKLPGKHNWSAQSGVSLILLGMIALGAIMASAASNLLLAWLILVSGIAEAALAFRTRRPDGFFAHLVPGIVAIPVGLFMTVHPAADARTWMVMFASFLTIVGLFRAISAYWLKSSNWPWQVFDGVVTVALATVLWSTPLWMATWFPALCVAVSLILRGWSSVIGAAGFRAPRSESPPAVAERETRARSSTHLDRVRAIDPR
jgi:uncharacterized membrane protein HdeD (DUF308 family)